MARPTKTPEEKYRTPARQLGRVDSETWENLQAAAEKEGKTFTQWALEILKKRAKKILENLS